MKIAFVDIETSGLDFNIHVVLDIAIVVVDYSDSKKKRIGYTSCIECDEKDWILAEEEALLINGFSEENHFPSKKDWQAGKEIEEFLVKNKIQNGNSFFLCQNPSFDRPFFYQLLSQNRMKELNMPYHWLDLASMYWIKTYGSMDIDPKSISLSKDDIAHTFGIPPEDKPHKALKGALHLIKCYEALRLF